jgi:hypothetical protein
LIYFFFFFFNFPFLSSSKVESFTLFPCLVIDLLIRPLARCGVDQNGQSSRVTQEEGLISLETIGSDNRREGWDAD